MSEPDLTAELRDHLALALVPGLGPRLTAAVIAHFGSASQALKATASQLRAVPLIGEKLSEQFAAAFRSVDVDKELELLKKHAVRVRTIHDAAYPERLRSTADAPALLYLRGDFDDADHFSVGIVGSRSCTGYGRKVAERMAAGLARAGVTVVSGLARGIDGVAHQAALEAGGRTIAVLAGGLSRIYPPEHKDLAERIVAQGALVSETPMTVDPQPGMFPARNRIISGLSRGVVIVEANIRSGALITATHAAEQGREVFVVPGPVDSAASAGCLELIRKGARLVRDADDILEDLKGIAPVESPPAPKREQTGPTLFEESKNEPPRGLDEFQRRVWEALSSTRHMDELARELATPIGPLSLALLQLEMKKAVRRLPGNQYERR